MSELYGDPFRPRRRPTRVVRVGDVAIGGDNPIRIQSMTNTDTMDTRATVDQVAALARAGCEIVRVTAPSIRDAENLREIRRELEGRGVRVPLVADIHFTPNAAMIAAEVVEKVRINPGNYADKKKFEVREYDDVQYAAEIERVADRFRPLVRRCKDNGVAMRIGTNHGSLSDRIMNRFGDTPEGMVESALEFLDVCEDEDYLDVVFSMKASNTQVAIAAYRLLAARLEERRPGEPSYPFHVGVTEAGDAEDGRIKSAIGIGSLLEDGLGDTIRVSLTEDPVREVPVARRIAAAASRDLALAAASDAPIEVRSGHVADPFAHERRAARALDWAGLAVGGEAPVRVEVEVADALSRPERFAAELATELSLLRDLECESLLVEARDEAAVERLGRLREELDALGLEMPLSLRLPVAEAGAAEDPTAGAALSPTLAIGRCVGTIRADTTSAGIARFAERARKAHAAIEWELDCTAAEIPVLVERVAAGAGPTPADVSIGLTDRASLHASRVLVAALRDADLGEMPVVLRQRIEPDAAVEGPLGDSTGPGTFAIPESGLVDAAMRLGSLLCDGIGDVVSIRSGVGAGPAVDLAYRVLQGARLRTTRTEFISCPSCGRTLFDLEETTAKIKARTDHLSGVKIAVMGCIVNGPGEMADADFGYVGSGVGQITLYVGKEVVARAVPEAEATDRLVDLIREHGMWVERDGEEASAPVPAASSADADGASSA
jgi:(E)-4-hydroxy-3-methylbut-2-enyl-diphosphate synthase